MKVPIGFVIGFVAGAYVFSKLTEEQRAGITQKVDRFATTGRTGRIADSLRRNVGEVADVATDRVTDLTESATDVAASKIASQDTAGATATP